MRRPPGCAPHGGIARSQEGQQQQHEPDEQQNVHEVANVVHADETDDPGRQHNECDFEQHLASTAADRSRRGTSLRDNRDVARRPERSRMPIENGRETR
jgi:hypothetical protein